MNESIVTIVLILAFGLIYLALGTTLIACLGFNDDNKGRLMKHIIRIVLWPLVLGMLIIATLQNKVKWY
jgi:hypothetical protein